MASESIAHSASWAIDSEPIWARGIIVKYWPCKSKGVMPNIGNFESFLKQQSRKYWTFFHFIVSFFSIHTFLLACVAGTKRGRGRGRSMKGKREEMKKNQKNKQSKHNVTTPLCNEWKLWQGWSGAILGYGIWPLLCLPLPGNLMAGSWYPEIYYPRQCWRVSQGVWEGAWAQLMHKGKLNK